MIYLCDIYYIMFYGADEHAFILVWVHVIQKHVSAVWVVTTEQLAGYDVKATLTVSCPLFIS